MRSQTRNLWETAIKGIGVCDSHLWVNTPIVLPSPTRQYDPATRISLAANRLLHTKDGLLPTSAVMNELFGKYLALYTL